MKKNTEILKKRAERFNHIYEQMKEHKSNSEIVKLIADGHFLSERTVYNILKLKP